MAFETHKFWGVFLRKERIGFRFFGGGWIRVTHDGAVNVDWTK
jgi:hypothetical protein